MSSTSKNLPGDLNGSEIAIIGMACRFPGAKDVNEFWSNLRDGVESITFLGDEELRASGVEPALLSDPNYVKAAPILDNVEMFDAAFFGYTPREAEFIDPQQRLFLECAWEALEYAGYDPKNCKGAVGVFGGAKTSTYLFNLFANPSRTGPLDITEIGLGNDLANLTTRISYKFNLKGPSYSLHTACSTSLVAVHLACQSLLVDECQVALAGGVAVNVPQKSGYLYQPGGVLSPDGHCRAFDEKAAGTLFGSGVGLVVLKRLEEAINDGDTIYAVIKGSATNNDGALKASFTAPGVEGQVAVISEALAVSEVEPDTIDYVETHGTGTSLGDSIEIRALARAFEETGQRSPSETASVAIGSVKTNLGHLDTAAGISSLLKTVLALKNGQLPPTLHFEKPNPALSLEQTPFYVNHKLVDWPRSPQHPRRAGVSSFGFGSTNAHLILEEAPELESQPVERPAWVLPISARSQAALEVQAAKVAAHLEQHPELSLAEVAYTLQIGRHPFNHRRVVAGRNREEILAALTDPGSGQAWSGVVEVPDRPVVFMFSGQGSQYPDMGRGLYESEPLFRSEIDRCAELLKPHLGFDLRTVLYPTASDLETARRRLNETALTQPALFVVEYALAQLWMSWGVQPQALIGHSIGEYVAACLAGVFSLEDALALVAARGKLMQEIPAGAMLSVPLSSQELSSRLGDSLELAAINAPSLCVVAGPVAAIERLQAELNRQGLEASRLHTSHAFHSRMMQPILAVFEAVVAKIRLQPPQLPVISNLTGAWLTAEQATDPRYWANHLRQTVQFSDGLATLSQNPQRVLLEIGPGQTLGQLARMQPDRPVAQVILSSLNGPREQGNHYLKLLSSLGKLWLAGVKPDWAALYGEQTPRRVALPTYPFERQRYWIDPDNRARPGGLLNQQATSTKKADLGEWFYFPSWKRDLLRPGGSNEPQQWLFFRDECGLSENLARLLRQDGHSVIEVQAGENFEQIASEIYTIRPQNTQDYQKLLESLWAKNLQPSQIVHAWSLTAEAADSAMPASFEQAQALGFYSLLYLAQALVNQTEAENARISLTVLSNEIYSVTGNDNISPAKSTLLAICKVLPQEYPHLTCRNIDLTLPSQNSGRWQQLTLQLGQELTNRPEQTELAVAYRNGQRWVQIFEPCYLDEKLKTQARLRLKGVYLITGGLGGIGLALAQHLAETVQARLVLVSRSSFPAPAAWEHWLTSHNAEDPTSRRIRRLQSFIDHGAEVLVGQANVADPAQLRQVLDQVEAHYGELNGVIHAAGLVSQDGFATLVETSQEIAQRHFQAKVLGLMALEQVLRERQVRPDFCLLSSSVATILGGVVGVSYVAANLFMDAFAQRQHQTGVTEWLCVNWPEWQANQPEQSYKSLQSANSAAILPEEGREAFARILALQTAGQITVSNFELGQQIDRWIGLNDLHQEAGAGAASGHARPQVQNEYVAPRNEYETRIAEIWQQVIGIDQIGVNDDFFELGGHSLLVTQLLNKLRKIYPVELSMRNLFECPTVAGMARLVAEAYQSQNMNQPPIRQLLKQSSLVERYTLLEDYWKNKLTLLFNQLPEDGSLGAFDLSGVIAEIQWYFQSDFKLQVYPSEIPHLQSIDELVRFTDSELERIARLRKVETTSPVSIFEQYEPFAQTEPNLKPATLKPAKKNRPAFFLLSSPRSGSTLLRVLLAGHPGLFSPPELEILWYETMQEWSRSMTDPGYGHGFDWASQGLQWAIMELLGLDTEGSRAYLDDLAAKKVPVHEVYAQLQQLASPRKLIDKSPSYSLSLATLQRAEALFDRPKYIFLVRHPYSMMESFLRMRMDKLFGPNIYRRNDVDPYVVAEKVWLTSNRNIHDFLAEIEPERQKLVRYEDMVKETPQVMAELCDFLEVPFDEAVLHPYDDKRERMITGIGDPNILQHDKVDPQLGEVWRDIKLPRRLGFEARNLAAEFDYELPDVTGEVAQEHQNMVDSVLEELEGLSPEEVRALLEQL